MGAFERSPILRLVKHEEDEVNEVETARVGAADAACGDCCDVAHAGPAVAPCSSCRGTGVVHRSPELAPGERVVHPGARAACGSGACRALGTTGRAHAQRPTLVRPGTRFWSEGLRTTCRVLSVDAVSLRFASESTTEPNIETDVPLDLAARHVRHGRWRLL